VGGDPYFGSYDFTTLIEATRRGVEAQLSEYVRRHVPSGITVSCEIGAGSPAAMIDEYAEGAGVDLVVLGTHGRGGLSRFLLGSVAERTLRMARHPILIVRQAATGEG
jgi:nucleotide-binding universal stress UspA family protein